MKRRRIIFAERTFPATYQREAHPLDDVFEVLLSGERFVLLIALLDPFPVSEADEIRLRMSVENDVVEEYSVEPPLRLVTNIKSAEDGGARAMVEFLLD